MKQMQNDDFDWTIGSGATPSEETGPDSAISGSRPNYLYIEATNRRHNDTAV